MLSACICVGRASAETVNFDSSEYGPDLFLSQSQGSERFVSQGRVRTARILVLKEPRKLLFFSGKTLLKTYRIELGLDPVGPKEREGDNRTPEGEYVVCAHHPYSKYHRGLFLNYPNAQDVRRGLRDGLISQMQAANILSKLNRGLCPPWDTPLGGLIEIHGQPPARTERLTALQAANPLRAGLLPGDVDPASWVRGFDWTWGCVAMANPDVRELYDLVPNGTPVVILPISSNSNDLLLAQTR